MSYDQWKTASPYDDEPDITEELQRARQLINRQIIELDNIKSIVDAAIEWIDEQ